MKHPDDNKTIDLIDAANPTLKRGRKPLAAAEPVTDVVTAAVAAQYGAAATAVVLLDQQVQTQTQTLALELGYEGRLDIGALEDEIRFYQRRTVEACMELGKRLLLLKELTPHGEFKQRIELLGISYRMAAKFMGATLKLGKSASKALLTAVGTQTKLLELLVLDDEEVERLSSGDSVGEVSLDTIDTMSVSELRRALRDRDQQLQAKDKVLGDRSSKIDQLEEKLHKPFKPSPFAAARTAEEKVLLDALHTALSAANGGFNQLVEVMTDMSAADVSETCTLAAHNDLIWLGQRLVAVMRDHGVAFDLEAEVVPSWVREGQAKLKNAGGLNGAN